MLGGVGVGAVSGVECHYVLCVRFTNSLTEFYFIRMVVTIVGIFMAILFILNNAFRLSVTMVTK